MSDIQVTRRDREMVEESLGAQLEAHFGSAWPRGNDLAGWWRSVGQTVIEFMKGHSCFCSDAYEKTIAQARAEGVASERARWIAEVDRAEAWLEHRAGEADEASGGLYRPYYQDGRSSAFEDSALRMREMKATMMKEHGND